MQHEDATGAYNISAPEPLPNREFMALFRRACGRRFGLPANRLMLEIGSFFLRTETELVIKSRRVVPGRLQAGDFTFKFPRIAEALADLQRRA